MQGKKSFILYADLLHTLSKLPPDDAGNLFKLILEYVNDQNPDESKYGLVVEVAFSQVKQQLKRDLSKWNENREQRSKAGKISAEKRKQQNQQALTHVESVERTSTKSTVNDNVNGSIIKGLCDVFGITEMNNPKSYFAATHFIENLSRTHRLEYFQKQIHAYPLVLKKEFRHKFQNFIGDPKQNYENGEWCAKTYEVTQEQKQKKQDGDALLNSLRTD